MNPEAVAVGVDYGAPSKGVVALVCDDGVRLLEVEDPSTLTVEDMTRGMLEEIARGWDAMRARDREPFTVENLLAKLDEMRQPIPIRPLGDAVRVSWGPHNLADLRRQLAEAPRVPADEVERLTKRLRARVREGEPRPAPRPTSAPARFRPLPATNGPNRRTRRRS